MVRGSWAVEVGLRRGTCQTFEVQEVIRRVGAEGVLGQLAVLGALRGEAGNGQVLVDTGEHPSLQKHRPRPCWLPVLLTAPNLPNIIPDIVEVLNGLGAETSSEAIRHEGQSKARERQKEKDRR